MESRSLTPLAAKLLVLALCLGTTTATYLPRNYFMPARPWGTKQLQGQYQINPLLYPYLFQASRPDTQQALQQAMQQKQDSMQLYLDRLLQQLASHSSTSQGQQEEEAEEQQQQQQETYEDLQQSLQETLTNILDSVYGRVSTTQPTNEDDDEEVQNVTTAANAVTPSTYDDNEDDNNEETTTITSVTSGVFTTPAAGDDDDDDNEATTIAPATYAPDTTPAVEDDDDDDDNDATTIAAATYAPDTTPAVEDDDDDDDNDATTIAPATYAPDTTPAVEDDDDDDDNEATTIAPATYAPDTTPAVEDDDDDDDDDNNGLPTTEVIKTFFSPHDDSDENSEEEESTTTAAPRGHSHSDSDLCDGCDLRHGVGYNPHPSDCTLYIQCRADKDGKPVVAGVRSCPHGLYWNQDKLTCDYRHNVNCQDDICRAGAVRKTKAADASCRGYWDCSSGTAMAKCCAVGFAYNPFTGRCNYDPKCTDDCLSSSTPFVAECPNGMRPVPGDRTKYEVRTGTTWTRMSCPANLGFSTRPCGCNVALDAPVQQECVPELYLPFTTNAQDESGRGVWVKNEGVQVRDGKAYFDGNSRLMVPRFSNTWWGPTVYVHLRYKSAEADNRRLALVSNGDCQVLPSLAACTGPAGVEFYAETANSPQPANFTVPIFDQSYGWQDGWQEVLYRLEDGSLTGYANLNIDSRPALGNLETRQRGLVIGSGGGCEDFRGFIDEVTVYLCRPELK